MSKRSFSIAILIASFSISLPSVAQIHRIVDHFPSPAPGSFSVVGTNLPDGRLVLWNGDQIFIQTQAGSGLFGLVASGYAGDPGFITLAPDGQTVLLGAGFSPNLYLFDTANPVDYMPGSEITGPTHFSGVYLTPTLLVLDRGNATFTGSELFILDLSSSKSAPRLHTVMTLSKLPEEKQLVLDKPPFSFSSGLKVDPTGTLLYVMDGNLLELRTFLVADLINAFNTSSMLDWNADGTLVGAAGIYFGSGVAGIRPGGELVIAGSLGFLQPGGIQIVDPGTGAILQTLDPSGNQDFYTAIYNSVTDEIVARTGSGVVYATPQAIMSVPASTSAGLLLLVMSMVFLASNRLKRS